MLKKNEVIEILEQGGHITMNEIYRSATVYYEDCSDPVGVCRYDTAERIERSAGYITERGEAWSFTRRIKKTPANYWDGLSARVEAATREALAHAGMLAEETTATQEAPAAEEAPERQPTSYLRADGDEATRSAAEALRWHRAGHDIIVARYGQGSVYVHGAPQETARQEDENRAHCKHIALELDAYVNGEVKRCPDCGEIHRRDWGDVGDAFKCPNCGEIASVDDWEWLGVHDFLQDCYGIEYRCDSRRELRSVQITVACGGPNICLDTASKDVELYWWSERARYPMSYKAVEALDEWAEEMWACL